MTILSLLRIGIGRAWVSFGLGGPGNGGPPLVEHPGCCEVSFTPTASASTEFTPTADAAVSFTPTASATVTFEGC